MNDDKLYRITLVFCGDNVGDTVSRGVILLRSDGTFEGELVETSFGKADIIGKLEVDGSLKFTKKYSEPNKHGTPAEILYSLDLSSVSMGENNVSFNSGWNG